MRRAGVAAFRSVPPGMLTTTVEPVTAYPGSSFRPVGAQVSSDGVFFRVWAPGHASVRIATGDGTTTRYITLEQEPDAEEGYLSGRDERGRPGDLYWYQIEHQLVPDPASRFQPRGVDGPSQVVDPHAFAWRTAKWSRPPLRGRVIYELHVGAFTPEGT